MDTGADANTSNEIQNPLEESSITMLDVLEQEKELEEEYAAVLGASDEKCCTFTQGYVKRQALYSCLTCVPEARKDLEKCAGICLACSYRCHENHELVELYTKRNFRCDCPTERLAGEKGCLLNAALEMPQKNNELNAYNQNFQAVYCKCHRPYPDPERTTEEIMLQCAICEDWFHMKHLSLPNVEGAEKLVEACSEMICDSCMEQHAFLRNYTGLALKALENLDESANNSIVKVDSPLCETVAKAGADNVLHSELDKSITEIMNMKDNAKANEALNRDDNTAEQPINKRARLESDECAASTTTKAQVKAELCRMPKQQKYNEKGATFWSNEWRSALCTCTTCLAMYKAEKVEFLLDAEDSAKSYEERGIKRAANETSSYEQGIRALASIGRVQQIDAITEYNRMKDKLKEYLQTFAASKKVVTEEDINRFFAEMRNEKNNALGQPYFCR